MTAVVPDAVGEILMLQYIVGMVNADNPVIHLYANDHTPSDSTVIGDLTEVATATGYAPVTLLSTNWTTTQSSGVTTAIYSEQTFTFTTAATSYGYYITNESNQLLWLEKFGTGTFAIPEGGGSISIEAKLVLS